MVEVEFDREKILAIALRGVGGSADVSLLGISTIAIFLSVVQLPKRDEEKDMNSTTAEFFGYVSGAKGLVLFKDKWVNRIAEQLATEEVFEWIFELAVDSTGIDLTWLIGWTATQMQNRFRN